MKQIKDILQDKKKTYIQTSKIQSTCAHIISQIIDVSIPPSKIQYKNNHLAISASPTIKTEIYIQKGRILKEINKQGITLTKIQ